MLDNEKDIFIKKELQKDKFISSKANDVFKNFEKEITSGKEESNNESFSKKMMKMTAVAASFVVAATVGAGVAYHGASNTKIQDAENIESSQISSINIIDKPSAADYITAEVKNEEIKVEKSKEKKVCENDLLRAVLSEDGSVAIGIKNTLLNEHKLKLDTSKTYKVSGIAKNEVKDIFIGSLREKKYPYVFMIKLDGTVNYVKIIDEQKLSRSASNYEFNLCDCGKIEGLNRIVNFEEKTEPIADSNDEYYYINAIRNDGVKKEINSLDMVNMKDVSQNKVSFKSQDGEDTYYIESDEGNYIQAFGWAGASNNVYYINDSCLYHINLVDGKKKKLITGVSKIWNDDMGQIYVKLKISNVIHRYDQYVKIEDYAVTDSEVQDTKEDENIILNLKKDGSITIELKLGVKKKLGIENKFRENYIYNFCASGHCISVKDVYKDDGAYDNTGLDYSESYANATAIHIGNIGTKDKWCVIYAEKDKKEVVIDILSYFKESQFSEHTNKPVDQEFLISNCQHSHNIKEYRDTSYTIKSKDGTEVECNMVESVYEDDTISLVSISDLLAQEGYNDYDIVKKSN